MKSKQTIHNPHPQNITMVASWYNMIKVTELVYDAANDKYFVSTKAKKSINLDHIYIAGSSLFEQDGPK